MTSETIRVHLDVVDDTIPVHVDTLGDAARARFLAMYPGDPKPNAANQDQIEWFVEVTEYATQFSESDIWSLPMEDMMDLCAEVVPTALELEQHNPTTVPTDGWMVVSR